MLAFLVPSDSVEITGNWDVMGLRGTGSFDYTIPEQVVEEGRTFWLFDGEPRCGGGVYRLGVVGFAGIGHAGWALGVARRALDEIQASSPPAGPASAAARCGTTRSSSGRSASTPSRCARSASSCTTRSEASSSASTPATR